MATRHKAVLYTDAHPPADHNHTAAGDGGTLTAPELVNYIQATNVAAPSTPASGKSRIFVRSSDKVLCTIDDTGTVRPYSTTSGTVTSVAMTVPTGFAISGSPVTTTGTLAVTESTQAANIVKAGPTSGGAATPAYRALVTNDLPSIGTAGTYNRVSTDLKGRVLSGSNNAFEVAVTEITANYTATANDCLILCDTTSHPFTLTLPSAATGTNTRGYIIRQKGTGANDLTIAGTGGDTIEVTTLSDGQGVLMMSNTVATWYATLNYGF